MGLMSLTAVVVEVAALVALLNFAEFVDVPPDKRSIVEVTVLVEVEVSVMALLTILAVIGDGPLDGVTAVVDRKE